MGFLLIGFSTVAQAGSLLVDLGHAQGDEGRPALQLQILWGGLATLVVAVPLAAVRWRRDAFRLVNMPKQDRACSYSPAAWVAMLAAGIALFLMKEAIYIGTTSVLLVSGQASWPEIRIFTNLEPLPIIVARTLGGCQPTVGPLGLVAGGLILAGAFVCWTTLHVNDASSFTMDLAGIAVALLGALYTVCISRARKTVPASYTHALSMLVVVLLALSIIFATTTQLLFLAPFDRQFGVLGFMVLSRDRAGVYAYSAFVCYTLGSLGYASSMHFVPALMVSVARAIQPFVADLEGAVALGRPLPSAHYLAGGALLVLGAVFAAKESSVTVTVIRADKAVTKLDSKVRIPTKSYTEERKGAAGRGEGKRWVSPGRARGGTFRGTKQRPFQQDGTETRKLFDDKNKEPAFSIRGYMW